MKKYLLALLLLAAPLAADSPWLLYGATVVSGGTNHDNPTPSVNGLVGEVTSLPYVVPSGYELVITNYGIEGGKTPQYAFIPWIGSGSFTQNSQGLFTCAAAYGSNLYTGMEWRIPEGTHVNFRVSNSSNDGIAYAFGWYAEGYLHEVD